MRGKFITIYGINNIGKSTHAKKLVKRLKAEGLRAEYVKYPVYDLDPSGPILNKVLRGGEQTMSEDELQLWFVLNRYQYEAEVRRMLDDGVILIAEDYIGTGIAWGTSKGLPEEWLENVNSRLLVEDFAILMEGRRELGSKEEGHVHENNEKLVMKCTEVLDRLAEKNNWSRVRVQKKKNDTAELMWSVVSLFLKIDA